MFLLESVYVCLFVCNTICVYAVVGGAVGGGYEKESEFELSMS